MRLPLRKHERLKIHKDEGSLYLTKDGLEKLKHTLVDLQKVQLPQAIEDVKRTAEFGDFSENAEYQEAKGRLRRIHARIFSITKDLKRVSIITQNAHALGQVQMGSTVVLETNGMQKTYQIVGPHEANPVKGRVSHVSPLGSALVGKKIGESVSIKTTQGEVMYQIVSIA
ncbi:MAG: transcription elongation factor GreA [Patescibacteria group bacterium]